MKLKSLLLAAAVSMAICAVPAMAQPADISSINDSPAATLLMPYFQVDLSNSNGWTTVMSINNASATAVLAHVVVWSDLSVPVLAFNVYLTGYDVQTIDLRTVMSATLPQTGSAGQDPSDTISPKGQFSQDINFASCTGQLPYAPLPAGYVPHIQNSLTGLGSAFYSGKCSGLAYGDNIARGYVTVDTVNNCTTRAPDDLAYYVNDLTYQNVLWGDFYYVNSSNNLSRGNSLIHVHSDLTDSRTTTAGEYTFYGRYVNWTAIDHRQPLATNFATRYLGNVLFFPTGTEYLAWRDTKTDQQPFTCGSKPTWYPLSQEGMLEFDEQEQPNIIFPPPVFPQPPTPSFLPFPAATQITTVNGGASNPPGSTFPMPFNRGWIYMNLNTTIAGNNNPPVDPAAAQAVVMVTYNNAGHYSVGYRTVQLDSASDALHCLPGSFCFN